MSWVQVKSPNYTTGRQGVNIDRIYIHWMVGTLASTDAVFQNTSIGTSAHYGIENGNVHQYVAEQNTAYHAGTWSENLRSIGIEHSAAPGRDATPQTLETSAQLIADICRRRGIPCDRAHIRKHSENIATQCPGTIPIDWLVARASQILNGGDDMPKIQNTPNWKSRFARLHRQFLPWEMSDEVFASIVGQDAWTVVENWSDHPNADQNITNSRLGALALRDNWQQQIYDRAAERDAATRERNEARDEAAKYKTESQGKDVVINDLKAQLAVQSDDTKNLNAFGEALQWFIKRVGLK